MSAGTLALLVAVAFSVLSLSAALAGERSSRALPFASATLLASAGFSGLAVGLLAQHLWSADLGVSFVARHATVNLGPGWRLVALVAEPAVLALCASVPALVGAWWEASRRPSSAASATAAAVGVVLLAGAAVAPPFRETGFLPADGLGLALGLRDPLAVMARVALVGAVWATSVGVVRATRGAGPAWVDALGPVLLLFALGFSWEGELRTGVSRAAQPLVLGGGRPAIAAAIAVAARLLRAGARGSPEATWASLASLGAALALLLGRPGDRVGSLLLVSAAVLLVGSAWLRWHQRLTWPIRAPRTASGYAMLLALAVAALALVGTSLGTVSRVTLAPGARSEDAAPARAALEHQGVSRYEEGDSHVVALALVLRDPGGVGDVVLDPEMREFVNSRDQAVDSVARRPAARWTPARRDLAWLDAVGEGDTVVVEVHRRPLAAAWPLAGALLAFGLLAMAVRDSTVGQGCATCGERPERKARFCSGCGTPIG